MNPYDLSTIPKKGTQNQAPQKRAKNAIKRLIYDWSVDQIALPLEDINSLFNGNLPVDSRKVCPAVEFGTVRLILPERGATMPMEFRLTPQKAFEFDVKDDGRRAFWRDVAKDLLSGEIKQRPQRTTE